jgi:hypothetical protein
MGLGLAAGEQLVWSCDQCGIEIPDSEGIVWCEEHSAIRTAEEKREWDASHRGAVNVDEFLDLPSSMPWTALHFECLPESEVGPYGINVERIRSVWDFLAWTSHLMGKDWVVEATNWPTMVHQLAELGGSKEALLSGGSGSRAAVTDHFGESGTLR